MSPTATMPLKSDTKSSKVSGKWVPQTFFFNPALAQKIEAELDLLSGLPPDWDGYGAKAMDPAMIQAARAFAKSLGDCAPMPSVVPISSGEIQFEWARQDRELEIELNCDGVVHYLKWSPSENVEEEDSFDSADTSRVMALIEWLAKGRDKCQQAAQIAAPK